MHLDIPFTETRPLRIQGRRIALRRASVLSTLIRQMSHWISARLLERRSIAQLRTMDDRMLRDIGLRREQIERIGCMEGYPEHE